MFRTLRTVVLAVCAGAALAGCTVKTEFTTGPTISEQSFEQGISDALQKGVGQRPDTVKCPGSVKATVGQTARCVLSAGGERYGLTATITAIDNGRAKYDVQVDNQPLPSS